MEQEKHALREFVLGLAAGVVYPTDERRAGGILILVRGRPALPDGRKPASVACQAMASTGPQEFNEMTCAAMLTIELIVEREASSRGIPFLTLWFEIAELLNTRRASGARETYGRTMDLGPDDLDRSPQ